MNSRIQFVVVCLFMVRKMNLLQIPGGILNLKCKKLIKTLHSRDCLIPGILLPVGFL